MVWTDAYVIINIDTHNIVLIIITVFIHGANNSNQRHTLYSPRSIVASGFCNIDIAILNEAPLIADSTLIGVSYHFPSPVNLLQSSLIITHHNRLLLPPRFSCSTIQSNAAYVIHLRVLAPAYLHRLRWACNYELSRFVESKSRRICCHINLINQQTIQPQCTALHLHSSFCAIKPQLL